jgi:hypothetical protein
MVRDIPSPLRDTGISWVFSCENMSWFLYDGYFMSYSLLVYDDPFPAYRSWYPGTG